MRKIIKKVSVCVLSLGLLAGIGSALPAIARPACGCDNPRERIEYVDSCTRLISCDNCGWSDSWYVCRP